MAIPSLTLRCSKIRGSIMRESSPIIAAYFLISWTKSKKGFAIESGMPRILNPVSKFCTGYLSPMRRRSFRPQVLSDAAFRNGPKWPDHIHRGITLSGNRIETWESKFSFFLAQQGERCCSLRDLRFQEKPRDCARAKVLRRIFFESLWQLGEN